MGGLRFWGIRQVLCLSGSIRAAGGKRQVSTAPSGVPVWRRDGRELFYVDRDRSLMVVAVVPKGNTLEIGTPQKLFGPIYGKSTAAAATTTACRRTAGAF